MTKRVAISLKDGNTENHKGVDRIRLTNGLFQMFFHLGGMMGEREIGINIDRISRYEVEDE